MVIKLLYIIQLNVLTTATLGTEQSGRGREVTVVEELSSRVNVWIVPPKSGHCREVAVSGSFDCIYTVNCLYCGHSGQCVGDLISQTL